MNKLTNLEVDEISILSSGVRPAVPGALVRIAKSDVLGPLMKSAGETLLEERAQEIQKGAGVTFAKAYTMALEESPGLYTQHLAEMAKRDPKEILQELGEEERRKAPKKSEEEDELELMARKRSAETGESFSKAYANVLATDEGARLYQAIVEGE